MRNTLLLIAGAALAVSAWANNCPNEVKAIDAKLATNPSLPKADLDKVKKLRDSGDAAHKAGKHADSMKDLNEAKKILGI
jgi:hypothetical protein